MNEHEKTLVAFALNTLAILESCEEWGADTLDEISADAHRQSLTYRDAFAMFKAKPEPREPERCTQCGEADNRNGKHGPGYCGQHSGCADN